ncbi:OmpA family protein [Veillonella criceti]|uniref:Inner membrane lipoprotein YiaD n=1 Tax=Veillonella criceti TaxID=103891 RepID=A0A380NMH8_9FIRM|nr:OmpA family protein [Veillonella criceti]SUP44778.1 Inner membrane lipoprotein YiaD precursor [Veillonella criceti]
MKKRALLLAVVAACVTSATFATPQTQWQEGEWQVDLGAWNVEASTDTNKLFGDAGIGDVTTNDKWNLQGGVTYGLNNLWALQYNYYGLETKDSNSTADFHTDGNSQEVNLLYSINKNFAAYAGWNRIDNKIKGDDEIGSRKNNIAQIGIIGKASLTDKLDVYGKAAIGTKNTTIWEAGLGYSITPDLDVNAGYRYINTKLVDKGDYDVIGDDANISYKGFIAGLSYRFGSDSYEIEEPTPAPVYRPQSQPQTVPVVQQMPAPRNDYYLESVHFGFDEDQPLGTEQSKLDHFVQVAKANPTHTFKLVGNTDAKGSNDYNTALSQRRVNNVAAYAQSQGVAASQLVLNYKGEVNPVSTNDTDQGRADNRRVDIWENK